MEGYPELFNRLQFLMERGDATMDDNIVVALGEVLRKERKVVDEMQCDCFKAEMRIPLPMVYKEETVKIRVGDKIMPMDLYCFKHKNRKLRKVKSTFAYFLNSWH